MASKARSGISAPARRASSRNSSFQLSASASPMTTTNDHSVQEVEPKQSLTVAAVGCVHGQLDKVFNAVAHYEHRNSTSVDLLVCCGDLQAVRHSGDLDSLAVPPKHKREGDFAKYANRERDAPLPVLAIGGNHEASDHMLELPFGGWLAKNVYFLGRAGAVWFGGVRFAGISGIYKPHDYHRGLWERPPCRNNHSGLRSAYHVRSFDVFRLKQLRERVDVGLSHDWPSGVVFHGDRQDLYRRKKHLKADAESNCLGNPPARELLDQLKPNWWLSGHLHVQFKAIVEHDDKVTHFYGMDKPGTKRPFLEVFDIPRDTTRPMRFERDSEWLSILRVSHPYTPLTSSTASLPANGDAEETLFEMDKLRNDTERILISNGGSAIPEYDEYSPRHDKLITSLFGTNNPQTVHMHTLLGMQQLSYGMTQTANSATESANPEELNIGDYAVSTNVDNPEEVDID